MSGNDVLDTVLAAASANESWPFSRKEGPESCKGVFLAWLKAENSAAAETALSSEPFFTFTRFMRWHRSGFPRKKQGWKIAPLLGAFVSVWKPQRFKFLWNDLYLLDWKYFGMTWLENVCLSWTLKDIPFGSHETTAWSSLVSESFRSKWSFHGNWRLLVSSIILEDLALPFSWTRLISSSLNW